MNANLHTCSKAYLTDITEQYLEAMVRGSLDGLPLASNLRVTSNSRVVKAGEGDTWKPGVRIVNRYTFLDPATRTSIFFGTIASGWPELESKRVWWHYAVRLSVDIEGKIFEIEEQSCRGQGADRVERPFKEAAIFASVLPEDERVSASELIHAAGSYFDALTSGDGSDGLFGPDCQRTECGVYTVNQTLETFEADTANQTPEPPQMEEFPPGLPPGGGTPGPPPGGFLPGFPGSVRSEFDLDDKFRWPVDNRRYYIIDEARGVVVAVVQFHRFGEDGIPGLTLFEAFKVVNGRISFIWAPAFTFCLEESGWPDWERPKR